LLVEHARVGTREASGGGTPLNPVRLVLCRRKKEEKTKDDKCARSLDGQCDGLSRD